jgi:hypothetical protein
MQLTDTILMVRPASFSYNAETARNNYFQKEISDPRIRVNESAVKQFDVMVGILQSHGINVLVIDDTIDPPKPDAIFPNNWMSTTSEGLVSVFPMYAGNRRLEKRDDILKKLQQQFVVNDFHDWSEFEAEAMYLEGTGSMVMDRANRLIYAGISERTHPAIVEKFAAANGFRAITFRANDQHGRAIYHTNVMMCIGDRFAVLCPKAISDDVERVAVAQLLETTGHENIYITQEQMDAFAGNMLQLKNRKGESLIVLSETALHALRPEQVSRLQHYGKLLPMDVSVIESGGGSVRCMMAEIFLEPKNVADLP